ncbi:MAG: uracil DNA glycosylase [Phylliscum demangeonii]|nr:MAG: uracil DNA glycosylase [Phylliscum demangeonii]
MSSTALKRKASDLGPGTTAAATVAAAATTKKPKGDGTITSFFGAPKKPANRDSGNTKNNDTTTTTAGPAAAAPSFDRAKWTATLTEEQRELLQLELDTLEESWLAALKDDLTTPSFLGLKRFLKTERDSGKTVYPPPEDIYAWYGRWLMAGGACSPLTPRTRRSRHTPLHTVKAVIIGQDPYHNAHQAHGLCFSIRPPTPAPASLQNIYKALKQDYPAFEPPAQRGGLLTPWAQRGVLLLNTCLTVRAHEANSHAGKGWEPFTQRVIDLVARRRSRGVVFLAWGSPAGKRVAKVDRARHLVLQSVHPSPLSANKGFFTCGHFKKTNDWLKTRYGDDADIDWNLDLHPPAPTRAGTAAESGPSVVMTTADTDL